MSYKKLLIGSGIMVAFAALVSVVSASHSWDGYHWARTSNPFTLELGDNVSFGWDAYLATTASDWSASSVLDTVVSVGRSSPRTCKPTSGRVELCNARYGNNGWLGLAQIWMSGPHITQGIVKVNDTYFNTSTYNTPAWRNFVMCQEVGHTFGLNHQDENFSNPNLGTCMDYTNNPTTNQHPNQHDYDQLATMYSHLDTVDTTSASLLKGAFGVGQGQGRPSAAQDIDVSDPSAWGQAVRTDARGNVSLYVRELNKGEKVFTFVTWIQ